MSGGLKRPPAISPERLPPPLGSSKEEIANYEGWKAGYEEGRNRPIEYAQSDLLRKARRYLNRWFGEGTEHRFTWTDDSAEVVDLVELLCPSSPPPDDEPELTPQERHAQEVICGMGLCGAIDRKTNHICIQKEKHTTPCFMRVSQDDSSDG